MSSCEFKENWNIVNNWWVHSHDCDECIELYEKARTYSKNFKVVNKVKLISSTNENEITIKIYQIDFTDEDDGNYSILLGFDDRDKCIIEFCEFEDMSCETEYEQEIMLMKLFEIYNEGEIFDRFCQTLGYGFPSIDINGKVKTYNNLSYTNYMKNKLTKDEIEMIEAYFQGTTYNVKIDRLENGVSINSSDGNYCRVGSVPMREMLKNGELETQFPK